MLRIKSIEATNFKLPGFHRDINPVTVYTGENGVGKSAIPEAAMLCGLGKIPWSRYQDVGKVYERYAPIQGADLLTQMILTNGKGADIPISRTIRPKGGSITQVLEYKGLKGGTGKIQPEIDKDLGLVAEALDFSKFEDMSAAEQKKFLFGLVGEPEGFTRESVKRDIANFLLHIPTPEDDWSVSLEDVLDELFKAWPEDDGTVRDNLVKLEAKARQMLSLENAESKRLHAVKQGMSTIETIEKSPVMGSHRDIKDELAKLDAMEKELIAAIEVEKAAVTAHQNWLRDNQTYQAELDLAEDRLAKLNQQAKDRNFQKEIETIQEGLKDDDWLEDQRKELAGFESRCAELTAEMTGQNDKLAKATAEYKKIEAAIKGLLCDNPVCPISKDACPVQWDKKAFAKKFKAAQNASEKASGALNATKLDYEDTLTEANKLTKEIREAESRNVSLNASIKCIQRDRDALDGAIANQTESRDAARSRYDNHIANDKRITSQDGPDKATQELTETRTKQITYREAMKVKEREHLHEQEMIKADIKIIETDERVGLVTKLLERVGPSGILGEALKASLAPMTDQINAYMPEGLKLFITPNGDALNINLEKDGLSRPFNAVSVGEMSILAAVVAMVFMIQKKSRLRVLVIDRMESIYKREREMLMKSVVRAVEAGELSNFIGGFVGDEGEFGDIAGVETVHLSKVGVTV